MTSQKQSGIIATLQYLEKQSKDFVRPMGELLVQDYGRDPFVLLMACLLSLRARDRIVYPICKILFAKVRTPHELLEMSREQLEAILRPIGFYRMKAATLHRVASLLLQEWQGVIPESEDLLMSIPGVGPKTVQFMQAYAFTKPAICVDTHVHRLANLFGWVQTRHVAETGRCLAELVPMSWWIRLNSLLVMWGQNVCKPVMSRIAHEKHLLICPCAAQFSLE